MKKLAIYYRVSTIKQKGNFRSKVKIGQGIEYAKQNDYHFETFDETKSGKSFDRIEWNKCYSKIMSGDFDALWVADLDRFGRNVHEASSVIEYFRQNNFIFITGDKGVRDLNDPDDEFMTYLQLNLAQRELRVINKRSKEGKDAEINAGKRRFCYVYGYDYKNKEKTIGKDARKESKEWYSKPEQVKVIKLIYSLFLNKGYGLHDIIKELNSKGYKPLKSKQWERTGVRNILKRIEYTGFTFNKAKEIIEHKFYKEKIISLDDWKRVQKRFPEQVTDNTRRGRNASYPASNIVKCAKCGKGFYYHEGKRILADGTPKWIRTYAHKFDYRYTKDKCEQKPKYIDFYLLNMLCHEVYMNEMNAGIVNLEKIVSNLQIKLDSDNKDLIASKERLEIQLDDKIKKENRFRKLIDTFEDAEDIENYNYYVNKLLDLGKEKNEIKSNISNINITLNQDQERKEKILAEFSFEKKQEYNFGTEREKRELLLNILESCTLDGERLQFSFITGKEYIFNIKDEKKKYWSVVRNKIYTDSYVKYSIFSDSEKYENAVKSKVFIPLSDSSIEEINDIKRKADYKKHKKEYSEEYTEDAENDDEDILLL